MTPEGTVRGSRRCGPAVAEFADESKSLEPSPQRSAGLESSDSGRTRGEEQAGHFYRSGTVGDWREHIPGPLAARCCEEIGDLMQSCGYDPRGGAGGAVEDLTAASSRS